VRCPARQLTAQQKIKQLGLVHVRTLKMTDDVLAVRYSPDGRLLAVALLDSTVKIFFANDLKFFLSLYGHKVGGCARA
jgi:U3 small nucleolar RNA-associated protein 12